MGTSNKRRKVQHYGVEEVKFDPTARQEYLTGFRKRKQVRVQHAQKISAEKERVAKIEERKQLREQRKREAEEHVKSVNEAIQKAENGDYDSDQATDRADDDLGTLNTHARSVAADDDGRETSEPRQEDEYVDEERHTTVTVEPMNPVGDGEGQGSREGSDRVDNTAWDSPHKASNDHNPRDRRATRGEGTAAVKAKRKSQVFHYESKNERKLERLQQTMKRRKAAAARRAGK